MASWLHIQQTFDASSFLHLKKHLADSSTGDSLVAATEPPSDIFHSAGSRLNPLIRIEVSPFPNVGSERP